jgi:hypothetical protein
VSADESLTDETLTPQIIVDFIKDNPGLIQSVTYPNPGEPILDESAFCKEEFWGYHCFDCDSTSTSYCHEDGIWCYDPTPEEIGFSIDSPEFGIAEFLQCSVENGQIIFESD